MELAELFRQARDAVDTAELPAEFRVPAFTHALSTLAEPVRPARRSGTDRARPGGRLTLVAEKLGIEPDHVDRLFLEHDGEPQFAGDVGKLGPHRSTRVLHLAVLLIAVRQWAGYDESVTADFVLRQEMERNRILDTKNHTSSLRDLKLYTIVNGSGKSATYKLKYEGQVKAAELAALVSAA